MWLVLANIYEQRWHFLLWLIARLTRSPFCSVTFEMVAVLWVCISEWLDEQNLLLTYYGHITWVRNKSFLFKSLKIWDCLLLHHNLAYSGFLQSDSKSIILATRVGESQFHLIPGVAISRNKGQLLQFAQIPVCFLTEISKSLLFCISFRNLSWINRLENPFLPLELFMDYFQ